MHGRKLHLLGPIATCLALGAVALVAGCGDDDKTSTSATKDVAATPTAFAIGAPKGTRTKLALEFPATVKAGLVTLTLTNSDTVPRSAQIMRITGDHTIDDVLEAVDEGPDDASDNPPIPSWIKDGGGVPTVAPGASRSVTQVLAPGRYGIWDEEGDEDGDDNDDLGAKGEFTVTGAASDAELPAQPATVTAKEYTFEFSGLKAGPNEVRFQNTGVQLHHALFFPIAKGATFADASKFFTSQGGPDGPPPIDFDNGTGTQVLDAMNEQNVTLDLEAGSYAVVCFIPDREGGASHVAKGMIKELVVK